MGSSKLDREDLKAKLMAEFEATLNAVADSVDNARDGAWIEDSEGLSRQALDRFRQRVYEACFGPFVRYETFPLLSIKKRKKKKKIQRKSRKKR